MSLDGLVGAFLDGHDQSFGHDVGIKANIGAHSGNASTHESQWKNLAFEPSLE